jgi:hypothetical protein
MSRLTHGTKLEKWMRENRYTDNAFAAGINGVTKGKPVSGRTVTKWRSGSTFPRVASMIAIKEFTKGAVTANDFV